MIRVLVASLDALAATGLRALLTGSPDLEIVGQASGVAEAGALARSAAPDVVLFDTGTGREAGDHVARLRAAMGDVPLVLLGGATAGAPVGRALRQGVRGYLPRGAAAEEMAAAIRAAVEGLVALHPSLMEALAQPWTALADEGASADEALTTREREVLQLLAEGLANKQIAQRLRISEHTVKFHVGEVMAKLGAASRTEAVTRAARRGLLVL